VSGDLRIALAGDGDESPQSGGLRIALAAAAGDPRDPRIQSGVPRQLLDALGERHEVIAIDASLRRSQRLSAALAAAHRDRATWQRRLHRGALATAARSRNLRAALAARPADVVLTVRSSYQPLALPYVPYVDNTLPVVQRHWPEWFPWRGAAARARLQAERRYLRGAAHVFATGRLVAESVVADYGVAPDAVSVVGGGAHRDLLANAAAPSPAGGRDPDALRLASSDDAPPPAGGQDPDALLFANAAATPPEAGGRDPDTLLFVGYDFERKGGPDLLRAFAELQRRRPRARLAIVGPDLRVEQAGVSVLGRVGDRARLARLYRAAGVFVLPARYEPYGMVVLEAMSHGLPVVATSVGALPETVAHGRTGLLVPPRDPTALAAALLALLEDPARAAALGAAGRARVERELTWAHVVERMLPALEAAALTAPAR